MPKLTLPNGWPDPYTLLRDPKWEDNYPYILLRGIYDIMSQGRISGDHERRYVAGFNITLWRLTKAKVPRFFPKMIRDGILNFDALTLKGKERELEVIGARRLSDESRKYYGNKTRSQMKADTRDKMKELRKLIAIVRASTPVEGMPTMSPTERGGT